MRLNDLLEKEDILSFPKELENIEIADIKIDHRQVQKGDVFIALKGVQHNGNKFAAEALKMGACCVVSEENLSIKNCVQVKNARRAYAVMSKHFFQDACDKLRIIAITGTNGKTTTASTIASVLQTAGAKVGTVGTLGASFSGQNIDTGFTTPDPYILHQLFLQMKNQGIEFVVMETSAHALALNKLDGITFEIGVLTNITEDHLDFFEDMKNYSNAKFKLFENGRVKLGIVCGGKEYSSALMQCAQVPMVCYGIGDEFDICATDVKKTFVGSQFACRYLGETFEIKTPLVGEYNIENSLAAIAVCRSIGIDEKLVQLGMNCLTPVEGRFNVISINGRNIIIDFAHTPDGLEKVLQTARELSHGKLTVVFGCGGNRDKQKRPIMGNVASNLADMVVLTSDNPRYEQPDDILQQIKQGATKDCIIQPDRKKAIEQTLAQSQPGETIIIAGKGGEKYQEIQGVKHPYNDFDVVYNYFRRNIRPVDEIVDYHEEENEVK